MIGAALLAAIAIAAPAHAHHPHRYWWMATDSCTIGTIQKGGVIRGVPGIVCTSSPAGWRTTPPPPID